MRVRRPLDAVATAYANLLADPCGSPVVHPVYPGGDAGFLFRAETFVTIGGGAGETAGILHWTPGYVNATNTEYLSSASTTSAGAPAIAAATSTPGKTFLANNTRGARCVAACAKVTFAGAESSRSGRVHYGLTSAGMIDAGATVSVDQVSQVLQHYSRTPADTFEVVWKPNIGDTEFNDPTEAAGALIRDRKSAITIAFAGLPAATGLTFHLVAIYEWTPSTGIGIGSNALGKAISQNTLDDVLDYLVSRGFKFVRQAGMAAAGGAMSGILNAVSQTFGNMPAYPRSRNARIMAY